MYSRQRTLSKYGRPQQPAAQTVTIPASFKGIDSLNALIAMPIDACLYTYNLMPSEYGLRLRQGYREWARGCIESPQRGTAEVRTILPFESKSQDAGDDRLFAVTDEGIWDVTLYNELAPTQVAIFTELGDESGRGVFCEFTGDAADTEGSFIRGHYMFYADGLNGIWQYDQDSGLWERPPSGDTAADWHYVDPADGTTLVPFPVEDVAFVMVHKQRIWVVLENDNDAWYLPVASVSGELKRFTFGSKFERGGNLVGLYNWTVDGGDGVDDYLIAISRGGDVVAYRGDDPEIIANGSNVGPWQTTGRWFIGEVPRSRRIVESYGADMFMLSVYGLTSLQGLFQGFGIESGEQVQSPSRNINRFLRGDVSSGKDFAQWQLTINPADGFLQVVTPTPTNTDTIQYGMNLSTGAWGIWRSAPITCGNAWNGDYFMGAQKEYVPRDLGVPTPGIVFIYDGGLDGTTLAGDEFYDETAVIGGDPVWANPNPGEYVCTLPVGTPEGVYAFQVQCPTVATLRTEYLVEYIATYNDGISFDDQQAFSHNVIYGQDRPDQMAGSRVAGGNARVMTANLASDVVTFQVVVGAPLTADCTVTITDVRIRKSPLLGDPIRFDVLTSFQAHGNHAQNKQVGLVRTIGAIAGEIQVNSEAVYDYRFAQSIREPSLVQNSGIDLWDSCVWDAATWDFASDGRSQLDGSLGLGRTFAIAMKGSSAVRFSLIGWDAIYRVGGLL